MNRLLVCCLVVLCLPLAAIAADDVLIADFEGPDYGDWKVTGEAFGPGPAQGTLAGQMAVSGFAGRGLVNTFFRGDGTIGALASPEFAIERKYLTFLIGGGNDKQKLALELLVDGKVVRSATGPNDRPGGSEELAADSWDVGEFAGKTATLRIRDEATGGWGHINVDQIVLTDRRPPGELKDARREFVVASRYLNLPIKNGAKKRVVTLLVDGKPVVRNDVELADGEPDWWAPMDVSAWKGKKVALVVDRLREDSQALAGVAPAETIDGETPLYGEPLRGQLHFSPRRGWNNDPNGLVYFGGEYHLFFQHNPYGWGWGNMHWGHAVSKDLVHWRELGDKLLPDRLGPMFSGSAVVDRGNTSGLGTKEKPPLVLLYTAAGNPAVQCLAASTDGRTFTKYAKNPVVKQITGGNRDPKVIWHAPSEQWVMVLYVELPGKHTVHFLTSPDLKQWKLASITPGGTPGKDGYLFECPDFFELPIQNDGDADAKQRKWVLLGANSEYAIGTFDGTRFTPEVSRLPGHFGQGFYAPQTFSDMPDERRVQIGWFQTETRGMPFNQSMTVPQELKLVSTPDGPRLSRTPVAELEELRDKPHELEGVSFEPGAANPLEEVKGELLELRAVIEPVAEGEIIFTLRGAKVSYDTPKQELVVNGRRAPAPLTGGKVDLTIFVDRTGLEVFAAGGLTYIPLPFIPDPEDQSVSIAATGGTANLPKLAVYTLRSIWR